MHLALELLSEVGYAGTDAARTERTRQPPPSPKVVTKCNLMNEAGVYREWREAGGTEEAAITLGLVPKV